MTIGVTSEQSPLTPEEATRLHRDIWSERGDRISRQFDVPECPYTGGELAELAAAGRRVGYLPPEVATRRTRDVLGAIFPLMGCYSLAPDNEVDNSVSWPGWFDYDASIDAPHLDTDETELLEQVTATGRRLMNLNQYIVASQDSRLLTGRYLDEVRTWARIGVEVTGRIVVVRFDGDEVAEGMGDEPPVSGSLLTAFDVDPSLRVPFAGGRSFGVARSQRDHHHEQEPPAAPRGVHRSQTGSLAPDAEWRRQVDQLLASGFHDELGLTADEYVASLPRFSAQPSAYAGRLDVPVLVETRIPWQRQYELTGIAISPFVAGFATPTPTGPDSAEREHPYAAWFNAWGGRFEQPISPAEARADLRDDEIGANLYEGGAVERAFPELTPSGRFFDFVGYVFPATDVDGGGANDAFAAIERTPGICLWRGRPEFAANLFPLAITLFRPLVRGRSISTL